MGILVARSGAHSGRDFGVGVCAGAEVLSSAVAVMQPEKGLFESVLAFLLPASLLLVFQLPAKEYLSGMGSEAQ